MKKILLKLNSLLLIVGLLFLISSCSSSPKEDENVGNDEEICVYDFEKTIQPVRMSSSFGKLSLSKDNVTNGKRSLKIEPLGDIEDYLYMYLPFVSTSLNIDYSDISNVSHVSMDVFVNTDVDLEVGLYFSSQAELRAEKNHFNLKQGSNKVEFDVRHSLISIQYDLKSCYGIYLAFKKEAVTNNAVAYLDNVCITKSDDIAEFEQNIFLVNTNDYFEIADFEHAYQKLLVTSYTSYNYAPLASLSVVKTSDYGIEAASGEYALRIVNYPSKNFGVITSWTQIFFSDMWLKEFDTSRFLNLEDYELKFDLYQIGDVPILFEINFYSGSGMDWDGISTKKGQWVEYSGSLTKFKSFIESPSKFGFSWADWDPALYDVGYGEYLFDNVRIEKVVK